MHVNEEGPTPHSASIQNCSHKPSLGFPLRCAAGSLTKALPLASLQSQPFEYLTADPSFTLNQLCCPGSLKECPILLIIKAFQRFRFTGWICPYLMGSSCKTNPTIIQGDDKLSPLQLHVHLASSEQDQRVHRHHAAVADEHPAGFDLLVVQQVGAVKVSDLEHKTSGDDSNATDNTRGPPPVPQTQIPPVSDLQNHLRSVPFQTCMCNYLLDISAWDLISTSNFLCSKEILDFPSTQYSSSE